MSDGATFVRFPLCDRWVDKTADDVVYAVEQLDPEGAFFHSHCPPERVGYMRQPLPKE